MRVRSSVVGAVAVAWSALAANACVSDESSPTPDSGAHDVARPDAAQADDATTTVGAGGDGAPQADASIADAGIDAPAHDAAPEAGPSSDAGTETDAGDAGAEAGSADAGSDAATCDDASCILGSDHQTLALFELNGDFTDTSGNGRDAVPIGLDAGTGSMYFEPTPWGQGLRVNGIADQGFDWSAYASLLLPPFTMEMILVPHADPGWQKLYGFDDTNDDGFYFYQGEFQAYPSPKVGTFVIGSPFYIAIVGNVSDAGDGTTPIDVYINGAFVASSTLTTTLPQTAAIFFCDDTYTSRQESLQATIDEVRLSSGARSAQEISDLWARYAASIPDAGSDAGSDAALDAAGAGD